VLPNFAMGFSISDIDSGLSKDFVVSNSILFGFLAFPYRFVRGNCPLLMMGIRVDAK